MIIKFSVSAEKFITGKNDKVNALDLAKVVALEQTKARIKSHKVVAEQTDTHELAKKPTHEEKKIAFVLFLAGLRWIMAGYQMLNVTKVQKST